MATEYIPKTSVFVLDNWLVSPTTVMVAQTGAVNPRYLQDNLLNQRVGSAWRWRNIYPAAAGWAVAVYDLGTAKLPNAFGLAGCNVAPGTNGVRFIGADSSDMVTGLQGFRFNTYDPGNSNVQLWYANEADAGPIPPAPPLAPKRFWGVFLLAPPLAGATYYELGVAMIGQRIEQAVEVGFKLDASDLSKSVQVDGGGQFYDVRPVPRSINVETTIAANGITAAFRAKLERAGMVRSLFADLMPWERTDLVLRTEHQIYGNLDKKIYGATQKAQLLSQVAFSLNEAL